MIKKILLTGLVLVFAAQWAQAAYLFIPMDNAQKNHLKAYGIAYWALQRKVVVDWDLNYRGGSFAMGFAKDLENECLIRGVSYEIIADAQYNKILTEIANPEANMDVVKLEKAPKMCVYTPKNKLPWDDAVTMVLTYAEIPYDIIYDEEVLTGVLPKYDWLHLHHEDFSGQYGKFYSRYRNFPWYVDDVKLQEATATKMGFKKVSQMKLAVAKKFREFVTGGGFMFAMCSATDSYDLALAADGVDICDVMYDGDGQDPNAQQKLDFNNCLAFKNFKLKTDPMEYEFTDIDVSETRNVPMQSDYFTLFDFSAKWDPIPSMLTQDHTHTIKGFMGQTTAFAKRVIKSNVLVMGENKSADEARYIHGELGNGTWSFYGGHDPEDYQHYVGDPPTNLDLHPNSPGYRLILNNVLFPAAKKKKQKT